MVAAPTARKATVSGAKIAIVAVEQGAADTPSLGAGIVYRTRISIVTRTVDGGKSTDPILAAILGAG